MYLELKIRPNYYKHQTVYFVKNNTIDDIAHRTVQYRHIKASLKHRTIADFLI